MEPTTPKIETIQALQHFLTIWKQDPVSQYALGIYSNNNVIFWDTEKPENFADITPDLQISENTIDIDELASTIFIDDLEELTTPQQTLETLPQEEQTDSLTKIEKDLMQTLNPQTTSRTNPFLSKSWKEQLDKILKQLKEKGRTREDQRKMIETYYYLGTLIYTQTEHQDQIRKIIEKYKGQRKTRDIWKSATRIQKIFMHKPKDLIYQTTHITITNIVKLSEKEFEKLLEIVQT